MLGRIEKNIIGLLLLIYGIISIQYSAKQGFWHDEIHTLTFLKGVSAYNFDGGILKSESFPTHANDYKKLIDDDKFLDGIPTLVLHEGHPPFYYLALKLWSKVFGYNEVGLRSFSIFCGLLAFLFMFFLFKRLGLKKNVFWAMVIVVTTNPFLFYFFSEARMYSLAFLLSAISIYALLNFNLSYNNCIVFIVSSTALLYTHYYGVFFLSTSLLAFLILRKRSKRDLLLIIPFILFIPWTYIILKQIQIHDVHWTDGFVGLRSSFEGFLYGISILLSSAGCKVNKWTMTMFVFLFSMGITSLYTKNKKVTVASFILLIIYFIQLLSFDFFLDNHTILIPRYYVFILMLIFGFMAIIVNSLSKIKVYVFTAFIVFFSLVSLYKIYDLIDNRKQMYREAAWYLDGLNNSNNICVVVEPNGPLNFGLSYYMKTNVRILPASKLVMTDSVNLVFVDENLGVQHNEGKLNSNEQRLLKEIPFVGLNIYSR